MKNKLYLTLLAAASFLFGCVSAPELPMQQLEVAADAIVSAATGAEYPVAVTSNTKWTVSSDGADWITADKEQSTGNATLTLTILPNEGEAREAVITLAAFSDNSIRRTISIRQSGANENGVISIKELRAMEETGKTVSLTAGTRVRGFVLTDPVVANWPDGTIAIEDSFTEAYSGVKVKLPEVPEYSQGVEVEVPLDGASLYRDETGYLVLEASKADSTDVTPVVVKPIVLDYTKLASGAYESMYVSLNMQVTDSGLNGVFSDCPLLEDADGNNARLNVLSESVLASTNTSDGSCYVSGIAGFASEIPQISPTSAADARFDGMRFGVKIGVRKLPYILSFYANSQKNKDLKYSVIKDGTYAKLGTDFYVKDKDDKIGAVFTAKTTEKMTGSGQFRMTHWADEAAHDNVPGKSFAGDDGSGYTLTVPLQTDLPSRFHIAFGMAGTGGAIKNWILSYSNDNETWYKGADFIIDKAISGSGFYYYYDLALEPEISFTAGNTLYLRWTATGTTGVNGSTVTGLGSDVRFSCCCAIFDEYSASTSVPAGAVYYEPFDNLTEGLDYLWGDRLAAMMNFCGSDISKWTDGQKNGLTGENVHQRRGYAQVGYVESQAVARAKYTNTVGSLTTPALGVNGDLNLSFDAMAYHTPADRPNAKAGEPADKNGDLTSVVVRIEGGGTIDGKTEVMVDGLSTSAFKNFSLKISGATAGTRITFTSAPASGEFSRWFIDNILVTK